MNANKELLFSRQIANYGSNAMNKLPELKILLIGLFWIRIRNYKKYYIFLTEKNIIFDNEITMKDSSSNFYIEEKDIIQRRVEISIKRIKFKCRR